MDSHLREKLKQDLDESLEKNSSGSLKGLSYCARLFTAHKVNA
jgi:hypothetical protein